VLRALVAGARGGPKAEEGERHGVSPGLYWDAALDAYLEERPGHRSAFLRHIPKRSSLTWLLPRIMPGEQVRWRNRRARGGRQDRKTEKKKAPRDLVPARRRIARRCRAGGRGARMKRTALRRRGCGPCAGIRATARAGRRRT